MELIEQSYAYCARIARNRAKNFYYSFLLLPERQRKAMCAIYAFMRYSDDLSDEPGATRSAMDCWRADLEDALKGRYRGHPVWPAFHHTVCSFAIPHEDFREMIEGVAQFGGNLVEHRGRDLQVEVGVPQLPRRVLERAAGDVCDPQRPEELEAWQPSRVGLRVPLAQLGVRLDDRWVLQQPVAEAVHDSGDREDAT